MKIIVTIKQVPDTNNVTINPKTGTMEREGIPSIINPEDKNALEAAITLKENKGAEVIVLTMGPPQAKEALKEALAMGADKAILLSDRAFAGADTWATSYTLSKAVEKIKDYDLIICGRQAIDGDTAQVGPELAEFLKLPQATYVHNIESIEDGQIFVKREVDNGSEVLKTKLPALLTVIKEMNEPRYPSVRGIVNTIKNPQIETWDISQLDLDEDYIGLNGSPTMVNKTFTPPPRTEVKMIEGTNQEICSKILDVLKEKNVI